MDLYETVINSPYYKEDLGREEILREIVKWLEDNFYDYDYCNPFDFIEDTPYQCPVRCDFENKEHMIKSFKEKFNIEQCCIMLILLKIIYFILEVLTRYLLMPFAALSVKVFELEDKIQNKFLYYLILIPSYLIFPITLLWMVLTIWQLDIQEKIKYRKQYPNWQ